MSFVPPASSSLVPPAVAPLEDKDRVIEFDPLRGGEKTQLTDEQAWANRPDFAAQNPITAAYNKYQDPGAMENAGTPYSYGRSFGSWLKKPNMLSNALHAGIIPGALTMGLGAGALALGGSAAKNLFSDEEHKTNTMRNTLLALIAGGGLGAWLAHNRQPKSASMYNFGGAGSNGNIREMVAQMLAVAPGLSNNDRFQYMAAVPQMNTSDLQQLMAIFRTGSGALIGAALARFFFGKGFVRAAAGALLGGLSANALTNRSQQRNTDFNGRQFRPF